MSFLSLISILTLSLATLTLGQGPPPPVSSSSAVVATPPPPASPSSSSAAATSSPASSAGSSAPVTSAPVSAPPPPSATSSLTPLASRTVDPNNIPYQVVGQDAGPRGPQAGYNLCNSTTEGPNSLCQTMFMNDPTNFCIWSSPKPNDLIANSEAYEVAWCTKPGTGARLIPAGTITGLQVLYANEYTQFVGYLDQSKVNLAATDSGGELDPHGDDEQGNPIGALAYSLTFDDSADKFDARLASHQNNTNSVTQVHEWVFFIGNGLFCAKFCKPTGPNPALLCNHIYDEIGCTYNAVADYSKINGSFEVCDSDDMTPPGVFTTAPGQTTTWVQPFTGNPQPPYTPNPISSSNCHTYQSTQLFAAVPTGLPSSQTPGAASSGGGPAPTGGSGDGNGAATFGVASLLVITCMVLGATITIVS